LGERGVFEVVEQPQLFFEQEGAVEAAVDVLDFVRRAPTPPPVPVAAWINKPDTKEAAH
jgi:hypothetical protein